MKIFKLKSNKVSLGITEQGGHLSDVTFIVNSKIIKPMHVAPWVNENLDDSIPPILKILRGDFFCAPFGDCDVLEDEIRPHGASANDFWNVINHTDSSIELSLNKKIVGAELHKKVLLKNDHPVVYQQHEFIGGEGKIPIGHHSMLKEDKKLHLSFSNYVWAGTPNKEIEVEPNGNSLLKYPQRFTSLKEVKLFDNSISDLTIYPTLENHEDLLMLVSDVSLPFSWSAASCPESGWLWFTLKNPKILCSTILWMSNGGRNYPPFSGRHKSVIGIEEVTSYFHLGHKASIETNELIKLGYKTYIELQPNKNYKIPYIFGLTEIPNNFKEVKNIESIKDGINIIDENDKSVLVRVDVNFLDNK